ncbi:Red chlorophyll catabolite reductase [Dichanthelium oligosanthes]|uniref:Red chlorophyll catabolite reductase n=1 Tax=Dichanthelium oligosanthes TaxID=888268 RepID=A0A1E5WD45_9POAL|nr:Red chlorophyll catabolite reductase [Dichanthelium oligosanthes]
MLRSEHYLRLLPATTPAFAAAPAPFSCPLPYRGATRLRLPRTRTPRLRGEPSSTLRASAVPDAVAPLAPEMLQREVARTLADQAVARLGPRLLPSAVPEDVAEFRNGAGNALGSLDVRRGAPRSSIDFMLQSSLHCKVPNGAIDITSILIFLNTATDAPHFLLELIQGSPTSIVVVLDLLPRKDLALHPDYLQKYYENTRLDEQRAKIEELPQACPYRSPSLFVRSACSPTAVLVTIDCGQGGEGALEEIVQGRLATVAKDVLQIWLDSCADSTTEMDDTERDCLLKRDQIVRSKSIEVDLTASLPRMFDPDVSSRIISEIRKAFGVQEP